VPTYAVRGSFYARRDFWQKFTMEHDADTEATAVHWALSEIGGCHGVKRHLIRIDSVAEVVPASAEPASPPRP
jgi:ribosomal protein L20A (L18A)